MSATTYTLDGIQDDGVLFTDRGLTAEQVASARANAERFGIRILNVFADNKPYAATDLAPFGIKA